jgi:glycosyltransferase involved in cell wall biosynthesis
VNSRVLHLNFSSSGGAGRAASRLADAQKQFGWAPEVLTASSSDLRTSPFEHPLHTAAAAADEFLVKKKAFATLFSLKRDGLSAIRSLPTDYDVYHFHWMNGLANLANESFLENKPIVWTLHDMNPFTGGCHYTLGCDKFTTNCGNCPAVKTMFQPQVASRLRTKAELYQSWSNLHVVTPSNWLAAEASRSELFKHLPVDVIPYSLDPVFFSQPKTTAPAASTRDTAVTIAVIAAQLDSPVKNVDFAVEAFRSASSSVSGLELVLVGNGGARFRGLPGVRMAGSLSTPEMISLLDDTDYLIVPSKADNSPLVALEAASRGVVPLVNNQAGLPEVVENLQMGFVFSSERQLIEILSSGLTRNLARKEQVSLRIEKLTHPKATASKYIELYESIR